MPSACFIYFWWYREENRDLLPFACSCCSTLSLLLGLQNNVKMLWLLHLRSLLQASAWEDPRFPKGDNGGAAFSPWLCLNSFFHSCINHCRGGYRCHRCQATSRLAVLLSVLEMAGSKDPVGQRQNLFGVLGTACELCTGNSWVQRCLTWTYRDGFTNQSSRIWSDLPKSWVSC